MNKKIIWCCNQKYGIRLVEPNDNLSREYIQKSKDTLISMSEDKGSWKMVKAYYACYHALYSILMKLGIKCEIHDCTIELIKVINGFSMSDYDFMKSLKEDREQVQYYLKEKELKDERKVKEFVLKCREMLEGLDINEARAAVKRCLND
jgi:uncharacterized protein (UPF0332 family)